MGVCKPAPLKGFGANATASRVYGDYRGGTKKGESPQTLERQGFNKRVGNENVASLTVPTVCDDNEGGGG